LSNDDAAAEGGSLSPSPMSGAEGLNEDVASGLTDGRQYRKGDPALDSYLRRRPFYVLGEVVNPGTYPYRPELSVTAAVEAAGGFTYRASRRWAHIRHAGSSDEETVPLRPDVLISPGDIIRIDGRSI
jgi:polysaccharide export outer membrane protein